ncbi:MAG TPA: cyclic beta 1-2 glucan synthetase, partial [Candidatus Riflebacteria bacterium]|nr:cyclic beta 1-2 glucan synthetase [Candidatus Riflebacteria bacterium]
IRGDWQIASWLRQNVPAPGGTTENNPLSWLSQWKIFDNLRRSLMPVAFTLMLVLSWSVLEPAWFWVALTLAMLMVQPLLASVFDLFRKPKEVLIRQHILYSLRDSGLSLTQLLLTVVCLPYEAFLSFDAVARTFWRLNVSHKLTLEWNASGGIDKTTGLSGSLRTMWFAPCFSLAVIAHATMSQPVVPAFVFIVAGSWLFSPVITWWISRPIARKKSSLAPEQSIFLRKIARRTWAFFETFVAPADNWLPPDNYQENRPVAIAHRTSPTNMGISLLANLAAHDFGYIATTKLLERTANSLQTMTRMPRHSGHFYNWYDTETLQPLMPMYVSSVDSGNLAAFLITLRSGLRLLKDRPIVNSRVFDGLSDTLAVLKEACKADSSNSPADFTEISRELAAVISACPKTIFSVLQSLKKLNVLADDLVRVLSTGAEGEGIYWARAFAQQCQDALADLVYHVPWAEFLDGAGKLSACVNEIPTLSGLAELNEDSLSLTAQLKDSMLEAGRRARKTIAAIAEVIDQLDDLANMDYSFLYDKVSHLLTIGYNVTESRRDASLYDLLASEARLATFVAIAQGQLPQSSWFALGRLLSNAGGDPVLLSWNGSMFEYLMPLLVMPNYANTLLDQTYGAVVDRQINYGIQCGVPWGVSESGYNMVDAHINYQYRAFGVPGLGLKRGLAEDLVIAPYASVMALMVKPQAACQNMQRLVELGFSGKYGFFEAIDYTPARQTRGQSGAVISSFMAHHQGMSLLALAYKLLDQPMQKRFASEPIFQATALLLQERVPKDTVYYPHATALDFRQSPDSIEAQIRVFNSPDTQVPQVQLLSNRNYHVMVTGSGGGYSRWHDFAVTRWRADTTRDNFGTFCYIRDMETLEFWSNTSQPALKKPESYEVIFSEGRAEYRR